MNYNIIPGIAKPGAGLNNYESRRLKGEQCCKRESFDRRERHRNTGISAVF